MDAATPPADPLVDAGSLRLCLGTAPPDSATDIARTLVEEGLAACVSLLPGVRSVYRWEGALQDQPESVLLIKAPADRLAALAARLEALHPYDVPELLVFRPEASLPAYLGWATAPEA